MPEAPPAAPPAADAPKLLRELVPQDLHDRGYLKDYLDKPQSPEAFAEIFKKLDGAETLIGKKTLIPDDKSKPEEVEAFYAKLGLAKADAYDVKALGEKADEAFSKEIQAAAHKGRLTQKQLNDFLEGMAPGITQRRAAQAEAQAARDKEFEALVAAAHGPENKPVLDRVQAALKEYTPKTHQPFIDSLDNKALAVLTGVINAIMVKYVPEDELNGTGNGAPAGAEGKAALQEEARKLQASPEWTDFRHPDHEKVQKRVKEIYASPVFQS